MKTLFGLTESQMWQVAYECRLEDWRNAIELVKDYPETELTPEQIDDITVFVERLWEDSERLNSVENDIIFEAIDLYLSTQQKEEQQ